MKLIFTPFIAMLVLAGLLAAGCKTLTDVGTTVGEATGKISPEEAAAIRRSAEALNKTFENLTPEQEYYIGRSVAAAILEGYAPYDNPRANEYVNLLGQSLALFSDKPETYGGYRFLLLDSDDINAFAAPGGLILITRGMARLCRNEEELAAVLAHEIGHVQLEHGLRAISSARLTSAFTIIAAEGARQFGSDSLRELTEQFEGSISDITHTLTSAGYSRRLEREADAACVAILQRSGYDPQALIRMLEQMAGRLQPGGLDFAKTHPSPADRIRDVQRMLDANVQAPQPSPDRVARFRAAMEGV
jgi:beta-barrel assembly-enhancing protease